jgi:23S rRNA pseudouridine1911/1915/1917 synthase
VGDEIEVQFVVSRELELVPENIPLDILYEDEWIIAVNKPAGMVVHPAFGNWTGTFVNALLYHCRHLERNDDVRPGIVHRLDKDTSGVLLAAKSVDVLRKLSDLFAERTIEKTYLAVCVGKPASQEVCVPIGRHPIHRKQMAVLQEGGKEATTILQQMQAGKRVSLVRLQPKTGRTHQLRVHMKHIGHPIVGDPLYGRDDINAAYGINHQLLHAYSLSFLHPVLQTQVVLHAPLPPKMDQIIEKEIGIFKMLG